MIRVVFKGGRLQALVHQLLDGGHQREVAGTGPLHQPAGDDEAVDLIRALKDAIDAGIAVGPLDRVLFYITVTAIDLDSVIHDSVEHLRTPYFQNGALDGVLLDALLNLTRVFRCAGIESRQRVVNHSDGAIGHAFHGEELGGGISQLLLNQAEAGDRLAEGLTLLGVADGVAKHRTGGAYTGRAQLEAADVENVEGYMVALAHFAKKVFHRHLAVGQHQRAGGGATEAELVLYPSYGETGSVFLD